MAWTAERDRLVTKVVVAIAVLVAVTGAVTVLALRLANDGLEPEGRNWWILAEVRDGVRLRAGRCTPADTAGTAMAGCGLRRRRRDAAARRRGGGVGGVDGG